MLLVVIEQGAQHCHTHKKKSKTQKVVSKKFKYKTVLEKINTDKGGDDEYDVESEAGPTADEEVGDRTDRNDRGAYCHGGQQLDGYD